MKKLLLLFAFLTASLQTWAQINYRVPGVNSWGLFNKPSKLKGFGLSQQLHFTDPNPRNGSIDGYASI